MDGTALLVLAWIASVALAAGVAGHREAGLCGALLGLLFGPLGFLAAFRLDQRMQCPLCHGRLDCFSGRQPKICPHCRTQFLPEDRSRGQTEERS